MAMSVRITFENVDIADQLEKDFRNKARRAVGAAATILLGVVRRRLKSGEDDGPEYRHGTLFRSYRKMNPRMRGNTATSGVRSSHPGAGRVEYGDIDERGIRTLPHPVVRPAVVETTPAIIDLLSERLP